MYDWPVSVRRSAERPEMPGAAPETPPPHAFGAAAAGCARRGKRAGRAATVRSLSNQPGGRAIDMLRNKALTISILAGAGAGLAAGGALAAPERVGGSDIWAAYATGKGKDRVCFVHGLPQSKRGKYKRRGVVYIQIAHRPADEVRDEVSITAGYTHKRDSTVGVEIDRVKFSLFTDRGTAWTEHAEMDRKFVRALIKGRRMVVKGRSSRNTLTTDTYTLNGFTAAYKAASRACGIPVR